MRAAHYLMDGPPLILVDWVAPSLFPASVIEGMAHPEQVQTLQARGLRAQILLRSRYAEDCLAEAVQRGIRQYLILGAGWDTFAYRQPEWAHDLRIFEVDHPASQWVKRNQLATTGITPPTNLAYIPIDFETTTLRDGLQSNGFDVQQPTFVSWLGVMVYLSQDAIDAVFRFVATLPAQSAMVFTFTNPTPDGRPSPLAQAADRQGEPWITYVTAADLLAYLPRLVSARSSSPPLKRLRSATSAASAKMGYFRCSAEIWPMSKSERSQLRLNR